MSVKSKYVMQLIDVNEDQNYFYFICEYCDGGDLLNYQAKQPQKVFTVKDSAKILSEVIHGLFLLHSMDYLHRDIKPQNILLKKDEAGNYVLPELCRCINWPILALQRENKKLEELFQVPKITWLHKFLVMIPTAFKLTCGHLESFSILCLICNSHSVHKL